MDEFATNSKRCRAGFEEFCRGLKIHAAPRNQRNVRQWAFQSLDVLRPADVPSGKNLHEIGASFPRGNDFGRRQRARHNQTALRDRECNGLRVESRTDQELRPSVEASLRLLWI